MTDDALARAFPDLGIVAPARVLGEGLRSRVVETADGIVLRIGKNAAAAEGTGASGRCCRCSGAAPDRRSRSPLVRAAVRCAAVRGARLPEAAREIAHADDAAPPGRRADRARACRVSGGAPPRADRRDRRGRPRSRAGAGDHVGSAAPGRAAAAPEPARRRRVRRRRRMVGRVPRRCPDASLPAGAPPRRSLVRARLDRRGVRPRHRYRGLRGGGRRRSGRGLLAVQLHLGDRSWIGARRLSRGRRRRRPGRHASDVASLGGARGGRADLRGPPHRIRTRSRNALRKLRAGPILNVAVRRA